MPQVNKHRVRKTKAQNRASFQQRLHGLVNEAKKTLEKLENLVQVSTPQARRHVEDMSEDLIEL